VQSVLALPFADRSFDAVLCMEVLEHLQHPADAVRELARVARDVVVLSVPFEPFFQAGNAARGKYPETWGDHPEHIQHWGRRSFPRY
jgi:ubiquinone/menaquinone biosynthesis C-methylase UbiE